MKGRGTFRRPGEAAEPLTRTGSSPSPPGVEAVADLVDPSAAPLPGGGAPAMGELAQLVPRIEAALAELAGSGDSQPIADGGPPPGPSVGVGPPGMPAAVIGQGLHVGPPHAHAHPPSLSPPAPPVPLPSIGPLLLSGAVSVLINGSPAARVGDVGIALTCGSLAPVFEVVSGSSTVWITERPAARVGDMTRHCNPIPMAAPAASPTAGPPAVIAAQVAADAATLALQSTVGSDPGVPPGVGALVVGSANVLIGGAPCPGGAAPGGGLLRVAAGLAGAADASAVLPRQVVGEGT